MNLQQGVQARTSVNGFNRRRFDREGGTRIENKMPPGKPGSSNFSSTCTFWSFVFLINWFYHVPDNPVS